jgi:hypothetical protein
MLGVEKTEVVKGSERKLTIVIILAVLVFVFFSCGINVMYFITQGFHIKIDRGQFWTLSILFSILVYFIIFFIRKKQWLKALTAYTILNVAVAGIDLVSYFLFKSPFLKKLIYVCFGLKW